MNKPHRWFKYVAEGRVEDYMRIGWIPLNTTYEGDYFVWLMEYICCCREIETPPYIQRKPK